MAWVCPWVHLCTVSISEALVPLFSLKPLHKHRTFKGWMEGTVFKYHIGAQHGDSPLIPVFTLEAKAGGILRVWGQPGIHNEFQASQTIQWLKHNLKFVYFSFGAHCADQANLEHLAILLPLLPGHIDRYAPVCPVTFSKILSFQSN